MEHRPNFEPTSGPLGRSRISAEYPDSSRFAATGTLIDLNLDEGVVRTNSRPQVRVGDGVRLRIRLPDLVDFDVAAQVVWVRPWPSAEGPAGFGARLSTVSLPIRMALRRWLQEHQEGEDSRLEVESSPKYSVECEQGRLRIQLHGILEGPESQALCDTVMRLLDDSRPSLVYIDARELRACPEDSLSRFGRWFQQLGRQSGFMGVLFASCAVARLQMRRLARESGIGNSLVSFESETDARLFWDELSTSGIAERVA